MKIKRFIEILSDYDGEKEIGFFEISDLYDTMMIALSEDDDAVYINIKNLERGKKKTVLQ